MRREIRDGTVTLKHLQIVRKNGRVYRYLRLPGQPRVKMPDLPTDHPDFLAAYLKAIGQTPVQSRAPLGSIVALVETYRRSERFLALSPDYQRVIRRHLSAIADQAGDARASHLKSAHIRADLAPLLPNVAAARLKAWRLVCAFGLEIEMLATDVSESVKRRKVPKTDGHLAWTMDQIDTYRARWPLGSVQRLCMEVVYWSGARISDAVLIGDGMIGRDGVLAFRQEKTGEPSYVPWTCAPPAYAAHLLPDREMLHAALAARPRRHMTFLATAQGRTRSKKSIGNLISDAAREAGVDRSAHGLRKSRCAALADGGANAMQIASWSGHLTLSEVQRYIVSADRRKAVTGTEQNQNSVKADIQAVNHE